MYLKHCVKLDFKLQLQLASTIIGQFIYLTITVVE